jgi:hypothetical protein
MSLCYAQFLIEKMKTGATRDPLFHQIQSFFLFALFVGLCYMLFGSLSPSSDSIFLSKVKNLHIL